MNNKKIVLIIGLIVVISFSLIWFNSNIMYPPTDTNIAPRIKCELSGGKWVEISLSGQHCSCENPLYSAGDYCIPGLDRRCKSNADCAGTRSCGCIKKGEVCVNPYENKYNTKYECVCYQGICNTNSLIPCEESCLDSEYCGEGFCRDIGRPQ